MWVIGTFCKKIEVSSYLTLFVFLPWVVAVIADQDYDLFPCFQCKRPVTGKQCSQKGVKKRGRSKYADILLGARSANTRQPSLASQELTLPSEGAKIRNLRSARLSHTCQECGKSFGHSDTLRLHQLVHKVEGMHDCAACGKSLEKGSLKKTPAKLNKGGRHQCTEWRAWMNQIMLSSTGMPTNLITALHAGQNSAVWNL